MRALNDYCYTVVCSVKNQFEEVKDAVKIQEKEQYHIDSEFWGFTPFEVMMGLESQLYQWDWIYNITSAHLVILLNAFLEKTLKYIHRWFVNEKIIIPVNKRNSKIFVWIYDLLKTNKAEFIKSKPEIYSVLEAVRVMRNNFAHDNLEGAELNDDEDYIYADRKFTPSFRLIAVFTAISEILYCIEGIYHEHTDNA